MPPALLSPTTTLSITLRAGQTSIDDYADIATDVSGNGSTTYSWSLAYIPGDGTGITNDLIDDKVMCHLNVPIDASTPDITALTNGLWGIYAELTYRGAGPAGDAFYQILVSTAVPTSVNRVYGQSWMTASAAVTLGAPDPSISEPVLCTASGFLEVYATDAINMTARLVGGTPSSTYELAANLYLRYLGQLS